MLLIMAGGMLIWSWTLFKAPLSIIRFMLSLLLVTLAGLHLSVLLFSSVASKCQALTTSKGLQYQALLLAVLAMALGLWSMVSTSSKRQMGSWYYFFYEILIIFLVTFEGLLFAEVIKAKE